MHGNKTRFAMHFENEQQCMSRLRYHSQMQPAQKTRKLCVSKTHSNACTATHTKTRTLPCILKTLGNVHHTCVTILFACAHLRMQATRKITLWWALRKRVTMGGALAIPFVCIWVFECRATGNKKKKMHVLPHRSKTYSNQLRKMCCVMHIKNKIATHVTFVTIRSHLRISKRMEIHKKKRTAHLCSFSFAFVFLNAW